MLIPAQPYKARQVISTCLAFLLLFVGCRETKKEEQAVQIGWEGKKAIRLELPLSLFPGMTETDIREQVQIRLEGSDTPVMGATYIYLENVIFEPVVPLSYNLGYEIWLEGRIVDRVRVPEPAGLTDPAIIAMYPSVDTVPENLLKVHILFSKPMREGMADKHMYVLKNEKDTVPVFLDMEFWNEDKTLLTRWLDPGRIKRDLQPHLSEGAPLEKNNHYRFHIRAGWKDLEGQVLSRPYDKSFYSIIRDQRSPDAGAWTVSRPAAGSRQKLRINLNESLDYALLQVAIWLKGPDGNEWKGRFIPGEKERVLDFFPENNWEPGYYEIMTESRLEDLAGNNLDRLFDRDIRKNPEINDKPVYRLRFEIGEN